MGSRIRTLLKEPLSEPIEDLDDPSATSVHRAIIQNKKMLRLIYEDFYEMLRDERQHSGLIRIVEIGSGAGFLKDMQSDAITSEVCYFPWVDLCFDATEMPFEDESVGIFFLLDVFHHIPDAEKFLREATRCLIPGGCILMIEPANTAWSRLVFRHFHHEPFDPNGGWELEEVGRLSHSNQALPWIVFVRDADRFSSLFPDLQVKINNYTQIRYLISGGLSVRQLLPTSAYPAVKFLEFLLSPLNLLLGYFMIIRVTKGTRDLI